MSFQAVTWAIEDAPDVPPHLVATLIGLANHADRDGSGAYPSQDTLTHYNRKTARQTKRDLDDLQSRGLIRLGDQRFVAHLRPDRRPLVWDLALDRTRPRGDTDDTPPGHGVTYRAPRGDTHGQNGVTPTSPKPKEEPKEEPLEPLVNAAASTPTDDEPAQGQLELPVLSKAGGQPPTRQDGTSELFEEFWRIYPRKVSKGSARKAWARVVKTQDPRELINSVTRFAASRRGEDPSFTPHATTWLNGERWLDEPAAVRNGDQPRGDGRSNGHVAYQNPPESAYYRQGTKK